ncbi:SMI1/KNR4 family protein [Brevibacillus borstelensis]|uniref:SMI1/KNR4 family protein n=1 Tax=Brevibacillus borstelensis TaxID=45462 RepID=UPI0022B5F06D|nr:SMI1/KNR4 family protein [Brevibacillus borstelensis]
MKTTSALERSLGLGAEESWIAGAEEELGFGLPQSFRWLLVHYGNVWLNDGKILAIVSPEHRGYDDSDKLYFFDTFSRDKQGGFPIMCYDPMNGMIDTYPTTLIDERS